jgi:hypothetical protein
MASKDAHLFRKTHGKLVRGWRKILEKERWEATNAKYLTEYGLNKLPSPRELATLKRLGNKLSAMGKKGVKDRPSPSGKVKAAFATFVSGGLPSLGKKS